MTPSWHDRPRRSAFAGSPTTEDPAAVADKVRPLASSALSSEIACASVSRARSRSAIARDRRAIKRDMSCPARFAFLAIVFGALALLCANTASAGATTRSAVEAAAQHHESAGAARLVASHASVSLRAGRLSGAVTTSNVGNVGAPATVATVRLSRNGRKIVVHVGRFDVPALRPHHHQRLAFSLVVPPHATAGRYRVEVCLDVLRHVKQRSRRLVCTGAGIVLLRSASTRTTTPPFDISPRPTSSRCHARRPPSALRSQVMEARTRSAAARGARLTTSTQHSQTYPARPHPFAQRSTQADTH